MWQIQKSKIDDQIELSMDPTVTFTGYIPSTRGGIWKLEKCMRKVRLH